MPTLVRYPPIAPGYGAYLDRLFVTLVQSGKAEADALATVAYVIENTKGISPPNSPGSGRRWPGC